MNKASSLSVPAANPEYGATTDVKGSSQHGSISSGTSRAWSGGTTPRSDRFQDADEEDSDSAAHSTIANAETTHYPDRTSSLVHPSPAPVLTGQDLSPGPSNLNLGDSSSMEASSGRTSFQGGYKAHGAHGSVPAVGTTTTNALPARTPPTTNGTLETEHGLYHRAAPDARVQNDWNPFARSDSSQRGTVLEYSPRPSISPARFPIGLPTGSYGRRSSSRRATRPGYMGSPNVCTNAGLPSPGLEIPTEYALLTGSIRTQSNGSSAPSAPTATESATPTTNTGSANRSHGMSALTNALGLGFAGDVPSPGSCVARPSSRAHSRPGSSVGVHSGPPMDTSQTVNSSAAQSPTTAPAPIPTTVPAAPVKTPPTPPQRSQQPRKNTSLSKFQQRSPGLALLIPGNKDTKDPTPTGVRSPSTPVETPTTIQSPKQASWFGSIFNWKPSSYTLFSHGTVQQTTDTLLGLFPHVGDVTISELPTSRSLPQGSDTFKCTAMGSRKAVRFRVEVVPLGDEESNDAAASSGLTVRVRLMHERGSHATFKSLFTALREQWRMDD